MKFQDNSDIIPQGAEDYDEERHQRQLRMAERTRRLAELRQLDAQQGSDDDGPVDNHAQEDYQGILEALELQNRERRRREREERIPASQQDYDFGRDGPRGLSKNGGLAERQ
jgi:hypothetical protein